MKWKMKALSGWGIFLTSLDAMTDYMIVVGGSLSCMSSCENFHDQLKFRDWIISYKMNWGQTC